jgi:hypothetical protein
MEGIMKRVHFLALLGAAAGVALLGRAPGVSQGLSALREKALAEPFRGVTTDGTVVPNLFAVRSTGVSTAPVKLAAERFLESLTDEQRKKTAYPVADIEWRKWDNVHRAPREGVRFEVMSETQKETAFGLLHASLSARGLEKTRNVMRLNGHLAELVNKPGEYGEGLYHLAVMGKPSLEEPWGGSSTGTIWSSTTSSWEIRS